MAAAAFLPSPMARMTVAAPRTMSPPAKTPGLLVMPSASISMLPFVELEVGGGLGEQRVGAGADGHDDDVAGDVELGARDGHRAAAAGGVGLAELHASGTRGRGPSPLSSPRIASGLVSISKMMPSSSAWWTSSTRAGISSRVRR